MPRFVLIVDDDPVQRRLAEAAIARVGYRPVCAEGGAAALAVMQAPGEGDIAAVVLDLMMPGMDGLEVMAQMRRLGLDIPVVVQTARGSIDTAVKAMRAGAFDFVVKPVAPERLQMAVTNAMKVEDRREQARTITARQKPERPEAAFGNLISASPQMERVEELARKAASSSIPILIEGESGVGKEVVARAIQGLGARRDKPFVTVNCGAIPQNLVESILFGHEKGAFTGATDRHVGKFVEADGGTLFLDEVGDLSLDVQVKLLRAVQQGEVDPVGSRSAVKVDIRLISATHRDLLQRVKDGLFREDLYYRLNVFPIHVPPLRERRGDIALLVQYFIAGIAAQHGNGGIAGITADALAMLCAYDWPGNVRQLENAVFRAVVLAEGDLLTQAEFPQIRAQVEAAGPDEALDQALQWQEDRTPEKLDDHTVRLPVFDTSGEIRALAEMEAEMIRLAIDHYNGQMSEVARRLGIGRSTLYRKLKEMGIDPEFQRPNSTARNSLSARI